MIRINQIKLKIQSDRNALTKKISDILRLKDGFTYEIVKKSVDSRKKNEIYDVYNVDVKLTFGNEDKLLKTCKNPNVMKAPCETYKPVMPDERKKKQRVVICGAGPAGLFCGLFLARAGFNPVIVERGRSVDERTAVIKGFWEGNALNPECNVQFGEGGAGTFSDGKLNTQVKDPSGRIREVLRTFVNFGAPADIMFEAKPHIGTDILRSVVKNIRLEIEKLGGKVLFSHKLTDIYITDQKVTGIRINDEFDMECDKLVICIGHSARDTFKMLVEKDLEAETKAFAVGLRVMHNQSLIDENKYKGLDMSLFPAAEYKVAAKYKDRGVYSFCMCPGGYVVNASSEKGMLCVNGMSNNARESGCANSAIVVTVSPEDFLSKDVLSGMYFQKDLEKAAFNAADGKIPLQLLGDFQKGRKSDGILSVKPMVKGQYAFTDIRGILPEYINETIIDGMKSFDKMISGFNAPDTVLAGVESRTSSPVRFVRGDDLQSTRVRGIYPCGEGAGYAGGITSACVDGIKVYEAIAQN